MPLPQLHFIKLEETDSTNNYCQQHHGQLQNNTIVYATEQTAGRGQRGNSWHSQAGKNLLFSIYLEPKNIDVKHSFVISMATALAIVDTIRPMLGKAPDITVKWPNDIYVGDNKIAGILIENVFAGEQVASTIIGVGLNVNEVDFPDWVPNPTSMELVTGTGHDLDTVLKRVTQAIVERIEMHDADFATLRDLHVAYCNSLWRNEGWHPYREADSGRRFTAEIATVLPSGHLVLHDTDGQTLQYAFKEVVQELE